MKAEDVKISDQFCKSDLDEWGPCNGLWRRAYRGRWKCSADSFQGAERPPEDLGDADKSRVGHCAGPSR